MNGQLGIVIRSGRARMQFKGSQSEFDEVKGGLEKIRRNVGAETLMIETVPSSDKRNIIDLEFKGSLADFGKVVGDLQDLKSRYAIETVPLPESPKIGSWPTPEDLEKSFMWTICASKQSYEDAH